MSLLCDFQNVLCLAKKNVYHEMNKHISIKLHFIKNIIAQGDMSEEFFWYVNQCSFGQEVWGIRWIPWDGQYEGASLAWQSMCLDDLSSRSYLMSSRWNWDSQLYKLVCFFLCQRVLQKLYQQVCEFHSYFKLN